MNNIKKVIIINSEAIHKFDHIEDYLVHVYGERKLEKSIKNSDITFLDVIGYTVDKNGYEKEDGKYYELREIEGLMLRKRNG